MYICFQCRRRELCSIIITSKLKKTKLQIFRYLMFIYTEGNKSRPFYCHLSAVKSLKGLSSILNSGPMVSAAICTFSKTPWNFCLFHDLLKVSKCLSEFEGHPSWMVIARGLLISPLILLYCELKEIPSNCLFSELSMGEEASLRFYIRTCFHRSLSSFPYPRSQGVRQDIPLITQLATT